MANSEREAFWRKLIKQREELQLTIDEICEQAGVSRASFYHWQQRFREQEQSRATKVPRCSPLVPIKIVDDRIAEITIELPGEVRVHVPQGCDESTLARIVKVLLTARGDA